MPIQIKLIFFYEKFSYYLECQIHDCKLVKYLGVRAIDSGHVLGPLVDKDIFPEIYAAAMNTLYALNIVKNENKGKPKKWRPEVTPELLQMIKNHLNEQRSYQSFTGNHNIPPDYWMMLTKSSPELTAISKAYNDYANDKKRFLPTYKGPFKI